MKIYEGEKLIEKVRMGMRIENCETESYANPVEIW